MTLLDGTEVHKGDKVRACGESGRLNVCLVLEILKGCGVDKALLTAGEKYTGRRSNFGTVIRTRYQIRPLRPVERKPRKSGGR